MKRQRGQLEPAPGNRSARKPRQEATRAGRLSSTFHGRGSVVRPRLEYLGRDATKWYRAREKSTGEWSSLSAIHASNAKPSKEMGFASNGPGIVGARQAGGDRQDD